MQTTARIRGLLALAEAVRSVLISHGVKESTLQATGYGEAQPISPNTTKQGRAQNRRVELHITNS